jgi:hypothetical protein
MHKTYPHGPKSEWQAQALDIISGRIPEVSNNIPMLLEWLRDYNWPGAKEIAQYLLSFGEALGPHLSEVLKSNDHIWKYWIISIIIDKLSKQHVVLIHSEIKDVACAFDKEEAHLSALEVLAKLRLEPPDILRDLLQSKRISCPECVEELNKIEKLIDN